MPLKGRRDGKEGDRIMKGLREIQMMAWIGCILLVTACSKSPSNPTVEKPPKENTMESDQKMEPDQETNSMEETDPIQKMVDQMSVEEKVGQIFMPAFRKNEQGQVLKALTHHIKEQIDQYHPGGIILFKENIQEVEQVIQFIQDLQQQSTIPFFVGIDEEGGRVSRLHGSGKIPATFLPGNFIIGKTQDPTLAYEVGKLLGKELSVLGFNMNFAPVADLWTNPQNTVIGERSFGPDPDLVGEMVAAMVQGMQEEQVSSVIKHFPGHGDTTLDSHHGQVIVPYTKEQLEQREWIPFQKGIQANADGVMMAHLQLPNIIKEPIPATFSQVLIEDILRQQLGHENLVITDALEMGAITQNWSTKEACIKAFKAGADILLMPSSLQEGYQGILEAVQQGEIPQERLDQSIYRILTVKNKRGILENQKKQQDPKQILGTPEHQEVVNKIRKKSM